MVIGTDENNNSGDYFKGNGNASVCSKKRVLYSDTVLHKLLQFIPLYMYM